MSNETTPASPPTTKVVNPTPTGKPDVLKMPPKSDNKPDAMSAERYTKLGERLDNIEARLEALENQDRSSIGEINALRNTIGEIDSRLIRRLNKLRVEA